ncbi:MULTISPECIES: Z1 domain-containing protein [unclassified Brenneria]|uniref:Z1 domain-containing protein n=1 Tax=unclassified Brenneria TaxID=2634434 RepID=UPI0029C486F3|nr:MULTISPECIES: Z1 domain-containing protein [unclassified Brenneria]MDX5629989.1 Z1 domain-containing protein [Brenneria sp. L3-3Z]MDX5697135.1 Z1 domain-containing protein [Brenneria sp. L4-2C]
MSITAITEERNIANALISGLANMAETPTRDQVEEKARQIASIFGYTGDLRNIVTEAMESVVTRMGAGISLVDVNAKHNDQWVHKREDITWSYANAYEEFLRNEGWPPQMVQSLSDVTNRILGHLQDPLSEGTSWNRRGLVIGHVQSGKTANYTGLIARAADAGYKFIVVIAGIHNNLRRQTQQRIDEAFIGRSSDPEDRRKIGVGLDPDYPGAATLTNINEDFNKNTAAKSGWKINDFSKPIILIIKKNVTTLTALHKWLKELNAEGKDRISDVPMLLIDDEADNASINTNKEDLDPTRTNAMIRRILGLFAKSCYVGYTATPFANIFINPDAYGDDVQEELFPRDFIYCLDAPTTYFGAEKVFLNEATSESIIRPIDDCEDLIPYSHKRDDPVHELPPSLYRALDEFIVARAIRNLRGQAGKHCSMMVNVSRFVPVQKAVRDFLSLREKKIREAALANYAMPEDVSSRNMYMKGLKEAFDAEYADVGVTWAEVKTALNGVFEHLHLYVINSKSDEVLDYTRYEKEGIGLTAIAVGGLSLSRGLTIEGLTVSYMYRNTKMYDTLMQMGRWFGYRPGFEDLCRVHLSRDSINWYSHIADAAEELVQQVKRMRRDRLSPKDFGLYVRSHPDSLLITAANKMRSGQEVTVEQSFSGRLRESYIVSTDPNVNAKNFELIADLWRSGFGGRPEKPTKKGVIFRDVSVEVIDDFLTRFECHSTFAGQKSDVVSYLERIATKRPLADVLLISPPGGSGGERPFTLRNQVRVVGKDQPNGTSWRLNKDRVASRGDEKLGLGDTQCDEARKVAGGEDGSGAVSDTHYRMVRNKPLLMIHSLEPKSETVTGPIAAFGVSFPYGDYLTTINVVVNKVWLQQMVGYADDPAEEEEQDD